MLNDSWGKRACIHAGQETRVEELFYSFCNMVKSIQVEPCYGDM
jgi:hypothetical protein